MIRPALLQGLLRVALILVACAMTACEKRPAADVVADPPVTQRANPASQNCVEKGGQHATATGPGGEYGLCLFPDNLQCEEWAMLRGACRTGGIKVTGYLTTAARYCAITGGQYAVSAASGTPGERGTCTLPNGKRCDADAYYQMTCGR